MTSTDISTIAPPRGMRDLLPEQVALRDWATKIILETYQSFGFNRIETPVLEQIQLLRGGEGGENLQLIFEVLKRGEKLHTLLEQGHSIKKEDLSDLGLRFDLTVPLVRYFSCNQSQIPSPLKSIQIGSVFRAESPQKGRFRQFTQCDIDIIGMKSELAEMELIDATTKALLALGFSNFCVHINDRRLLAKLANWCGFEQEKTSHVFITLDKLDKIGIDGISNELNKFGYLPKAISKLCDFINSFQKAITSNNSGLEILKNDFPDLIENEFIEPLNNVIKSIANISNSQYDIKFDPTLVRGMGYYTGQIFEIKHLEYGSSIAGGGRYDKMVGKFSGRDVPACGFSIGFERVIDILTEQGFKAQEDIDCIAFIVDPERDSDKGSQILRITEDLRKQKKKVSVLPKKKELKKQLDSLLSQGYTHYCIFKGDPNSIEIKQLQEK